MDGLPRERAPDTSSVPTDSPDRDPGDRHEGGGPHDPGGTDWRVLADAAWLAAARIGSARTGSPGPGRPPSDVPHPDAPFPTDLPPSGPHGPGADTVPGVSGVPGPPEFEREIRSVRERAHGSPDRMPGTGTAPVRATSLRLARSLRGLGRRVPTRARSVLDEEGTAEHGLADGLWVPYFLPDRERMFDLVLLVDRAPTMPPWAGTVRGIADDAAHSGAFRDVRTVGVTLPADDGEPALRWPGGRDGDPAELLDGRGSRLFLVVTDGLAHGWAGSGADRLLARLAAGGPTALVHLLPPYLRHRSSLFPFRAQLDAGGFGALNRRFDCRPPGGLRDPVRPLPEPADDTVPVPVLSVRAGSFRAWADLVTGERGVRRTLPVVLAGAMAKGASAPGLRTPALDGPRAAAAAVRRFRSLSSPLARQLAVLLAVVPMDFAVIEELRDRALPDAGPEHLAEVMMGGLIDWNAHGEGGPDFAGDVREALLATSTRTQLARTVGLLAELRTGGGHGARLRAALHDPVRAALPGTGPGARPWLRIELAVLRALAGPYAGRAARVAARLVRTPDDSAAHPGDIDASAVKVDRKYATVALDSVVSPGGSVSPTTPPAADTSAPADNTARRAHEDMEVKAPELRFVRSGQPKIMGNVPPKNPNFTGRESLLAAVERQLTEDETTAVLPHALHGLGGVGKSQIAVEYVYRHSAEYNVIWWIPAEQESLILGALAELARSLGLEVGPQANTAVPAVREALRTGKPFDNWLLVFDNAEDIEAVRSYFPNGGPGKIIVTSRNREWERVATPLSVDVFDREESIALLKRRARGLTTHDADRLAEALGDLPLAVEQAGAWHAATGMPVDEYLQLLEERRPEILELTPSPDYPLPVAAVWDISLGRLSVENPAARQLLQICACMAPEPIPLNMLRGGRNVQITPELDPVLRDPLLLARATRDLSKLSLVRLDHKAGTLQMHRLMQNVIVARLDPEERERMRNAAHLLLTTAKPGVPASPEQWPAYLGLLPHVIASEAVSSSDAWVRDLVFDMVTFLYYWGAHEAGADLTRKAWAAWRAQSGEEDLHVIRITKMLGFYLQHLGRIAEAAVLSEQALEISRGAPIPDEELIDSMLQMAGSLRYRGDFYAARDLDAEAFERASDLYGMEDPTTLSAAHSHGISLRVSGDFRRAKELDEETVRQRQLLYGPTSGLTLNTLNALAIDIREAGDFLEARALQESTYQTYLTHFGATNAATIRAALNLANCRRRAGLLEGASELVEEVLERFTTRYGAEYPETLGAAMAAVVDRRMAGRLEDSRRLGRQILVRYRDIFGEHHPYTMCAMVNVAATLRAVGDVEEAERLDAVAGERLRADLGERHPYTLAAALSRANDHYARLDFAGALEVDSTTLPLLTEVAGADHPMTLACVANLSLDQRGLGRSAEADRLNAQAVEGLTRVLGDQHPWQTSARLHQRIECDVVVMPL
ncbi:FxSxx-COOH system tetratricopeptide repeat protein [Streptomyces sp. C11-1]|uniref:FxSxx-COOH system tetratricopeptide repeat protein n=1 Tax=Streptomyces durocortorensis TaxID=2811104 RepID=A0ABY9W436_9ACTN|nr:FxSxx-COOH system tetratricopeptide repeat protein [Streptomyces durocortorensis]WNF30533.1 FxSxx-COOH system tetratricopeptide repeat protein [Streptomyces durocortorensis]